MALEPPGHISSLAAVIGAILILAFALLVYVGTRAYFAFQKIGIVFMAIQVVGAIILFFMFNQSQAAPIFNSYMQPLTGLANTYQNVTNTAIAAGYNLSPPFSWSDTLAVSSVLVVPMALGMGTTFIVGEVKQLKKSQLLAMPLASISFGILFLLTVVSLIYAFGRDFNYAANLLYNLDPAQYVPPMAPYNNYFYNMLLSHNFVLYLVMAIGFAAWSIYFIPMNTMITSRILLAMSFDRLLPQKLASVSERHATPTYATGFMVFIGMLSMVLMVTYPALEALALAFNFIIPIFLGNLSRVVFPFRLKALYESSAIKYDVAGIPLVSICGTIGMVFMAVIGYEFATNNLLFANAPLPVELTFGVFASAVFLFVIAYIYRKRKGLDLMLSYKEIPPE